MSTKEKLTLIETQAIITFPVKLENKIFSFLVVHLKLFSIIGYYVCWSLKALR